MANRRNRFLCHAAELRNSEDNITELRWYGMSWGAPTPSEDGVSLAQVENLSYPLKQSDSFGIDIYLSCLEAIQTVDV